MKHVVAVIALAVALAGTSALAGARQHFMAGQDYYTQGRYQKAIEEFEEAYRLDPRPLLLFNIAQAYEKLGDLEPAVDYLKRYLEAEPDSEDRTTLLNKVANLEARLAKTGVKVTCNVAEAVVHVDGQEVGKTPIANVVPVAAGAHKVQITKKGFRDFTMSVAVSSGQTTPVEALLEEGQSGPPPIAPVKTGEGEGEGAGEGEEEGGEIDALDVVPWVIAGVGAAAAIVGLGVIGGMAMANDNHDQAVIADAIGWPGVALAAGGTAWGVYNLAAGGGEEPETGDDTAAITVVPVVGDSIAGVAAVVQF